MSECIDHGRHKSLSPEGYALVAKPGQRGRCVRLHRMVYACKMGVHLNDIAGVVVRHTCDNPRCVNPEHLIGGTKADNNRDRAERGRSAKRVPAKHKLTPEDCRAIRRRYSPERVGIAAPNGVTQLARDYGVDPKIIYRVLRGTHPCEDVSI